MEKKKELEQNDIALIHTLLRLYVDGQLSSEGHHGEDIYGDESFDFEPVSRKDAKKLLKKLESLLNKSSLQKSEKAFISAKYGDWNRSADPDVTDKIDKAMNNKRIIYIEYYSPDSGRLSKRNLSPYAKNYRYVVGFCHVRKDIRKFRLSRIARAKILDEKFDVRELPATKVAGVQQAIS